MTPAMITVNPMLTMLHFSACAVQTTAEIQSRMLRQWAGMIPRFEDLAEVAMSTERSLLEESQAQAVPPKNVAV